MKYVNFLLISIFFLFLLTNTTYATNTYTIDFYEDGSGGSPITTFTPSFYTEQYDQCRVDLNSWLTCTSGTDYNTIMEWYSPNDELIGTFDYDWVTNISCTNIGGTGTDEYYSSTKTFEGKSRLIHTATSCTNYLRSKFTCNIDGSWINFTTNQSTKDSRNYYPNVYYEEVDWGYYTPDPEPSDLSSYLLDENHFGICKSVDVAPITNRSYERSGGWKKAYLFYYPFNSSSGTFVYDVDSTDWFIPLTPYVRYKRGYWFLYPLENPSGITMLCYNVLGFPKCNGTIELTENKIYVLTFEGVIDTTGSGENRWVISVPYKANFDILIYQPQWQCGNWSECINGTQYRTCVDLGGVKPDKVEVRSCITLPYAEKLLGFEESYNVTVSYCQSSFTCLTDYATTKSVQYPVNWSTNNVKIIVSDLSFNNTYAYDYLRITDEWSSERFKSLKMWYLPPQTRAFIYNETTHDFYCGNRTFGRIPQIQHDINESTFVALNVTFPSPYMTLSFDVKRCEQPEMQWKIDMLLWKCEQCYDQRGCNVTPEGRYRVLLVDTSTHETKYEYIGEADFTPKTIMLDLSNAGLQTNHNYTLYFAVSPTFFEWSPYSDCIYLDNVKMNFLQTPITCESHCGDGVTYPKTTYLKATYSSGVCSFEIIPMSELCMPEETREDVQAILEACESGCVGNDWVEVARLPDGNCTIVEIIENAEACITPPAPEVPSYLQPSPIFENFTNRTYLEEQGLDWLLYLGSPMFMGIFLAIFISGYLVYKLRETPYAGVLGVIVFFVILTAETLIGIFPQWLLIIEIIIAGFIFAKFIIGFIKG